MIKIFLDANKYLDFYRGKSKLMLLDQLINIKEHIIITEQVIDEILRNRICVTREYLTNRLNELDNSQIKKPFLYDRSETILDDIKKIDGEYAKIKKTVRETYNVYIQDVSTDNDTISKKLNEIFANKIKPKAVEIKKAKRRKLLGNPPGKKQDPIGDELSWEQLLSYGKVKNDDSIVLVTSDGDFIEESINDKKKIYLNSYLKKEIDTLNIKIIPFKDLEFALEYMKENQVSEITITPAELEKIAEESKEIESCPPHRVIQMQNGIFNDLFCTKCNKILHREYGEWND